jgi:hypothetical protein
MERHRGGELPGASSPSGIIRGMERDVTREQAEARGGAGVAGERHGARWGRTLLALTAGLLLTVPLLWAASIRSWAPKEVEGWRILPMLPREARLPLPSDLRMCTNSAQCEPPRVCFLDPRYLFPFCQGSDCVTDAQCPRGNACRSVPMEGQGVALRRCAPWGERTEGESCARLVWANQRGLACGAELVCVGEGWCGRRCEPGWPGSCPAGFFCGRGDPEGATCLPTCEGRTCPEGQRCVRHEGGVSACAVVHGGDCQQRPCEDGEVCDVLTRVERPGEVWMQCARPSPWAARRTPRSRGPASVMRRGRYPMHAAPRGRPLRASAA